ncbi:MAG: putative porin [Candidatus Omnitrophota bacterium]
MKRNFLIMLVFLLTLNAGSALAGEAEMMAMIQNLQKQMMQMQSVIDAQSQRLGQIEKHEAAIQIGGQGAEQGQAVAPMSEKEFSERLGKSLGGANKWLDGLVFKGDTRLRYSGSDYTSGSQSETPDRNAFFFRLRFGFEKAFSPEIKTGFELASGPQSAANGNNVAPTSNNQNMDSNFNFKNLWINKIFVTYLPEWAKVGPVAGLNITAGKVQNPFEEGSTDMIWDRDVTPEGIYEKVDFNIFKNDKVDLKGYAQAGQFVLDEDAAKGGRDAELFAYQVALSPTLDLGITQKPVKAFSALSFYNYAGYAKHSNFTIFGTSFAKGNPVTPWNTTELNAQGFNVFESYSSITFYPRGIPMKPFFDWARNMTDRSNMIMDGSDAWSVGLALGKVKKKHDLEASYAYKWIGANSVVGAFTDGDFGNGTAGQRGSVIRLGYGLTDNVTVNAAGFFTNSLNTGSYGILDQEHRKFILDLNLKF